MNVTADSVVGETRTARGDLARTVVSPDTSVDRATNVSRFLLFIRIVSRVVCAPQFSGIQVRVKVYSLVYIIEAIL